MRPDWRPLVSVPRLIPRARWPVGVSVVGPSMTTAGRSPSSLLPWPRKKLVGSRRRLSIADDKVDRAARIPGDRPPAQAGGRQPGRQSRWTKTLRRWSAQRFGSCIGRHFRPDATGVLWVATGQGCERAGVGDVRTGNGNPGNDHAARGVSEDHRPHIENRPYQEQDDRHGDGGGPATTTNSRSTATAPWCGALRDRRRGPWCRHASSLRSPAPGLEVGQAPQTQQPGAPLELSRAFARAQIFATRAPSRPAHQTITARSCIPSPEPQPPDRSSQEYGRPRRPPPRNRCTSDLTNEPAGLICQRIRAHRDRPSRLSSASLPPPSGRFR